ncbi:RibD family protein [Variovorax rhizosphaerae]|uniref:RibD family protein n=1 Tax=Variovorax rhizosphaerae TaxID=1836200 RepID=A0ABU8WYH9_9BURK
MKPETLPPLDVETLWRLCLHVVRQRRLGKAPQDGPALTWEASQGFTLGDEWSAEAGELFSLVKPLLDRTHGSAPWVLGQLGQSLNGCIATRGGDANYINGAEVLLHLHRLRALSDAVIVGAATAALDNPQLTTRRVEGDNPVRVVIDPSLRVPPSSKVFSDHAAPTLLVCDAEREAEAADRVGADQVLGVPRLTGSDGIVDVRAMQAALAGRGLRVLFVEGGGVTVSHFMRQGCMDRLHLSIAPVVIGDGRPGLSLPQDLSMGDCARPPCRLYRMGGDVLWDLDLRASAASDGMASTST